jgi:hypothetical protein
LGLNLFANSLTFTLCVDHIATTLESNEYQKQDEEDQRASSDGADN